jgi:ubiquinone/menaquinone biosynthesis C-methylase UbiE
MLAQAGPLPDRWRLIEARGEQIPFPPASFDLVTISYVLHVVDPGTRERILSEAARVLRPGGRIATVTIAPPVSPVARAITAPVRWAAERYPSVFVGLRPHDPARDLERSGFSKPVRRRDFRGYPALCLLAVRSQ